VNGTYANNDCTAAVATGTGATASQRRRPGAAVRGSGEPTAAAVMTVWGGGGLGETAAAAAAQTWQRMGRQPEGVTVLADHGSLLYEASIRVGRCAPPADWHG